MRDPFLRTIFIGLKAMNLEDLVVWYRIPGMEVGSIGVVVVIRISDNFGQALVGLPVEDSQGRQNTVVVGADVPAVQLPVQN